METLVAVQHRNQYHRSRIHSPARFGAFDSPSSSREFQGINCRSYQSGAGILPTPHLKSSATSVTRKSSSLSSPKTPSPSVNSLSDNSKLLKRAANSGADPIPISIGNDTNHEGGPFNDVFYCSERWAGPAYSYSPPPSSLPIPKFSLPPKRTFSLELPNSPPSYDFHPIAKSAPSSPTREYNHSPRDFFTTVDSATLNLRRILNLDVLDA